MSTTTTIDTGSRAGALGERPVYICPECGTTYDAAPGEPAPECDCDEDRMMTIQMTIAGKGATLTTSHAASSYGRPVLVVDGEAYGPRDVLTIDGEAHEARTWAAQARTALAPVMAHHDGFRVFGQEYPAGDAETAESRAARMADQDRIRAVLADWAGPDDL